jgi:hypothetical protein
MVADKASENMKRREIVRCDDSAQDEIYEDDKVRS